jgi:hypothetical protein
VSWEPPSKQQVFDLINEESDALGAIALTPDAFLQACRRHGVATDWPQLDRVVAIAWRLRTEGLIEIVPRNLGGQHVPTFDKVYVPGASGLTDYFEQIYPTPEGRATMRPREPTVAIGGNFTGQLAMGNITNNVELVELLDRLERQIDAEDATDETKGAVRSALETMRSVLTSAGGDSAARLLLDALQHVPHL